VITLDEIKLLEKQINPEALKVLPPRFVNRYKLFPVDITSTTLTLAISHTSDTNTINEISLMLDKRINLIKVSPQCIENAIKKYYGIGTVESIVSGITPEDHEETTTEDLQSLADKAPVIRLVNAIIREAIENRASDIHLEPYEKEIVLRYRIDGILHDISPPPRHLYPAIVSRIKIMAQLNIAEKRLPQDGRIRVNIDSRDIDLRVSTIPTLYGECVSIRILDKERIFLQLENLGLTTSDLNKYIQLINRSNGIILVTGPTGSGKTTTLYASLSRINSPEKKIITIEDPIEYNLYRVNQIQVKPEIGLTFASGLRAILRHNPDILMVGEIRDKETAEVAIQAALTGHLIFSTMHTNDSATAIARLQDMGIEDFLISSSLIGVLAQRLVRTICISCKGKGCSDCNDTGFKGRIGIFELLCVTPKIKKLILNRVDSHKIKEVAIQEGMSTLQIHGEQKVALGLTTKEEILRVI
jgi:general secretion pathway protein E